MRYSGIAYHLPRPLRRHILRFETEIEGAVGPSPVSAGGGARARRRRGRGTIREPLRAPALLWSRPGGGRRRLGLQPAWMRLPISPRCLSARRAFDAAIHIVTIEHLRSRASRWRKLRAPWCRAARCWWRRRMNGRSTRRRTIISASPAMASPICWKRPASRSLSFAPPAAISSCRAAALNGLQFFTGGVRWLLFFSAAILLVPPALVLPLAGLLSTGNAISHSATFARRAKARRIRKSLDGVIVVDKPEGWTSHDVVNKVAASRRPRKWATWERWTPSPPACCRW